MFAACPSLISVDLSNFDTKNVKNMANMFYGDKSLIDIDFSFFDTFNLVEFSYMFCVKSHILSETIGEQLDLYLR